MTPRQMSILIEEQGREIAGLRTELQAERDKCSGFVVQLANMTDKFIEALAEADTYRAELGEHRHVMRKLNEDRERFEWFFADDRISTDALVELQLRHINREKTTVDEWRNAIDQARNQ